jgi:hypothetical protein
MTNSDQSGVSYQSARTLTYAVMTGHRAGHLVQHVRRRMTGPVAGHDGGVSRVILSAVWYQFGNISALCFCASVVEIFAFSRW